MKIDLSKRTKDLIEELNIANINNSSSMLDIVNWLNIQEENIARLIIEEKQIADKKLKRLERDKRFRLESLRASLLTDLKNLYNKNNSNTQTYELIERKKIKSIPLFNKIQFGLMLLTGTVLALYDGFRGIVSFLGILPFLPPTAVLLIGTAFSLLSVIVYYGFDIAAISKNLGIQFHRSPKLIDLFYEELEAIKNLRYEINKTLANNPNLEQLQEIKNLTKMLQHRFAGICKDGEILAKSLNKTKVSYSKKIVHAATSCLYFGGGFFAGQALTIVILGTIGLTVAATFWPVIAFGIICGIGAVCSYIWMERPGVEKFVSRLFGINQEKIQSLCDQDKIATQKQKFCHLEGQIQTQITLQTQKALQTEPHAEETLDSISDSLPQTESLPNFAAIRKFGLYKTPENTIKIKPVNDLCFEEQEDSKETTSDFAFS